MDKKSCNVALTSKITSKNQVTIPKMIRKILKVKSSDEIEWKLGLEGQIVVKKRSPNESDVWSTVDEQERKYGSVDTPEVIGVQMVARRILTNGITAGRKDIG